MPILLRTLQLSQCPCGSAQTYSNCCEIFHTYQAYPKTAKQLMRSRYTAYALQLEGYLLDTWELSTRPAQFEFEAGLLWKSLIISECRKGRQKDAQGWVTFTAFYQVGLEHGKVREKSYFKRDGKGHWCYVDGEF